ncbi:MAG: LamG-like jellyroll fold domain-containing protein [Chloroflexota bacterium]
MRTLRIFPVCLILILPFFISAFPDPTLQFATPEQSQFSAQVEGYVKDGENGQSVFGASIQSPDVGLLLTSDTNGAFSHTFTDLPAPNIPITITVQAPNFGLWTLKNVHLLANDTLILDVQLHQQAVTIEIPDQEMLAEQPRHIPPVNPFLAPDFISTDLVLPEAIRIRVTGYPYCDLNRSYTVTTVEFKYYVKHVLPNEWSATWHRESLRAGAIAAKTYAWYWISRGGKWSDADVYDSTCDQVYNPAVAYQSTNAAVEDTWHWGFIRNGDLFQTSYRHLYSQCVNAGLAGTCMGQVDSNNMALAGSTWDEIVRYFYNNSELTPVVPLSPAGFALYFRATGHSDIDRVKISIGDPSTTLPGPPANVGAEDFTIEWWMKARAAKNTAPAVTCGANSVWRYGNMLLDRDRLNQNRYFGVSMADGKIVFGIGGENGEEFTLCGTTTVADGVWHHIAVQRRRSDGYLWLYVDGRLDAQANGPDGDISYPDNDIIGNSCGASGQEPCSNDPYLVLGAEKYDLGENYPAFYGWLDELRISNTLRYPSHFTTPHVPFVPDSHTQALYHFDTGYGNTILDSSSPGGGLSPGIRAYNSDKDAPDWVFSDLSSRVYIFFPLIVR